jgi:shikimate dehydrogenase
MDNQGFFAVFGNPVLHSRSPQLYNGLFSGDGINARYTRIHTGSGESVCEIIRMANLSGANITTPFKEEVMPFLDRLSPDAELLEAVNTIINRNGELTGHNTDAHGLTGSLKEAGIRPDGKKCMVMGAGGAGKAAAKGLMDAGADVMITNRTPGKAFEFASRTGCWFSGLEEAVKNLKSYDILVLALPPGTYPFDPGSLHEDLVIVDANYRLPSEASRNERFRGRVIRGDRWLLHQAVEAYRLFTGLNADISLMDKALKEDPDPTNISIRVIGDWQPGFHEEYREAYMLVDGRNKDDMELKQIIDEEKHKAFPGSG